MFYDDLEPKCVLYWFCEIAKIPHGSKNTAKISDFLVEFAKARSLEVTQDKLGNVIIKKPATAGYESAKPVILQGHMDMVCEKTADSDFNFETDGLNLEFDGEYIYAKDTTLGGDDGIAVAMILALLDAKDIPHPEIEAVITVDEEIGMLGAEFIDLSGLSGRTLINIDSEAEGVFTVGCAGGNVTKITLPLEFEEYFGEFYKIEISGLIGGHSGIEIDKGRASAAKLLITLLCGIDGVKIGSIFGGQKDNVIPNYASATVFANEDEILIAAQKYQKLFLEEYAKTDKNIKVSVTKIGKESAKVMNKDCAKTALNMLSELPNGIQKMSEEILGLPETSLNLGILNNNETELEASFCVRSAKGEEKRKLTEKLKEIATKYGAKIEVSGDYPAWEFKPDSDLRELMKEVFVSQYGFEPKVETVHAGLECGLFCGKLKGLDCISIGPNLIDIHTPKEKMEVKSVERTWNLVLETLKRMKNQQN